VGTLIGGVIGAIFTRKPVDKPETGDHVLAQRVAEMERRQSEMDDRIDDIFRLLDGVKSQLSTVAADVREALTRLQERRK